MKKTNIVNKTINIISVSILFFFDKIYAVVVKVPDWNWDDDVAVLWPTTVQWSERDIFVLINKINEYLRFSIWAICMWLLVYAGIKLIFSWWDEEANKKTSNLLIWAVIWIVVSMLSYVIVKLIVNLF